MDCSNRLSEHLPLVSISLSFSKKNINASAARTDRHILAIRPTPARRSNIIPSPSHRLFVVVFFFFFLLLLPPRYSGRPASRLRVRHSPPAKNMSIDRCADIKRRIVGLGLTHQEAIEVPSVIGPNSLLSLGSSRPTRDQTLTKYFPLYYHTAYKLDRQYRLVP